MHPSPLKAYSAEHTDVAKQLKQYLRLDLQDHRSEATEAFERMAKTLASMLATFRSEERNPECAPEARSLARDGAFEVTQIAINIAADCLQHGRVELAEIIDREIQFRSDDMPLCDRIDVLRSSKLFSSRTPQTKYRR